MSALIRVTDAETGARAELGRAGGPWLLRLCARVGDDGDSLSATDLRVLVVTDVLRRVAEGLGDAQAVTALLTPDRDGDLLAPVLGALRIPAFDALLPDPQQVGEALGAGRVVFLDASEPRRPDADAGGERNGHVRLQVGPVHGETDPHESPSDLAQRRASTVRFALLAQPRTQPLTLTADVLDQAEAELTYLRDQVADWAQRPSAGIPEAISAELYGGLVDDLDTGRVAELLRRIERDPELDAGAKFEAFVAADRFLALDLSAHLGR